MSGFRVRKGIVKTALVLVAVLLLVPALSVVTVQGLNQNSNMFAYQFLLPYLNNPSCQPVLAKADAVWGDTVIGSGESWFNESVVIVLDGNLTIESGGSLALSNVTLMVDCSFDGEHRIEVKGGGSLYINDTDGEPSTRGDASNITALNSSNSYLFWVDSGAVFQMNNSELHYCGYNQAIGISYDGLWINTNGTIVENNSFENNENGIILCDGYYNIVRNNNATNNNWYGFLLSDSGYNTLTGNTATNNGMSGFRLVESFYNNLTGNTAANNGMGFDLSQCDYNNLVGNVVSWEGVDYTHDYGFYLFSSEYNNLTDNTVSNSNPNDIDYGYWLYLNSNSNNLTNDTSVGNYRGFVLSNSSNYNILYACEAVDSKVSAYIMRDCEGNDLTASVAANYLQVRVVDLFGAPVSGVNVRMDVNGATVYDGVTVGDGCTDWVTVVYQRYSGQTPYGSVVEVWASDVGYKIVDMSTSHTETFIKDGGFLPVIVFSAAASQGSQAFSTVLVVGGLLGVVLAGSAFAVYMWRRKT